MTRRWNKGTGPDETLIDLVAGCILYSLVMEGIALIFVENRITFTLGLALGTLTAIACSIHMWWGIRRCLGLDPGRAGKTMAVYSVLRMLAMLAACAVGLFARPVSFYGVVTGLVGLKLSAYLHVYTNVYITGRLLDYYKRYKGNWRET